MRPLQLADHLRVYRAGYWHHAIYVGHGFVVHYTDVRHSKRLASIRIGTLAEFAQGRTYEVVEYTLCDDRETVLARAQSRIGETAYRVADNNCEHFATWCKTGVGESEQVHRAATTVGGAAANAVTSALVASAVAATGAAAGLSGGAGLMGGLGAAGSAIGLGAAGGIGVVAAAPAVVSAAAVGRALRDDPRLGADERQARKAGRAGGRWGAGLGTASAVALVSSVGIPGLSAAGLTTGLAGIGGVVGGGMVAGLMVTALVPAVACAGLAALAYAASRKRAPLGA